MGVAGTIHEHPRTHARTHARNKLPDTHGARTASPVLYTTGVHANHQQTCAPQAMSGHVRVRVHQHMSSRQVHGARRKSKTQHATHRTIPCLPFAGWVCVCVCARVCAWYIQRAQATHTDEHRETPGCTGVHMSTRALCNGWGGVSIPLP
jgi:hypothetical protein